MSRDWKLALHCHSDWSYDGHWPLRRIAQAFGRLGYDAVLMSEHDNGYDDRRFADYRAACAAASTPRCTLVPGIEYSSPDNRIHLLVWGMPRFLAFGRPVAETLERVAEGGGVAVFAHPSRREAWAAYDPAWTPLLSGVEVWNRKADGVAPGPEALELATRTGLAPTVGMDFHRVRHFWPLANMARGEGAAKDVALAALASGALVPSAFGRPLTAPDRTVRPGWHPTLEAARKRARVVLRPLGRNRA